jgi:transposase
MTTITFRIRDEDWKKIRDILRSGGGVYVGQEEKSRRFLEAVFWIARSGAQWRLLPPEYGNWNSVYKRFARWETKGIWECLFTTCADDPDLEHLLIDSTSIRAHPCAAGAPQSDTPPDPPDCDAEPADHALGRSRGGFSTKIHIAVDALGNPLRFILTGGQRHDSTQAEDLIADFDADYVIADKGYDTDALRETIAEQGAEAVIPPRANRKDPAAYDTHRYKERHLVECFINKIKHYRRIFSRFEKLATRYRAFLHFIGALIWLR